jgi:hypothetical protein
MRTSSLIPALLLVSLSAGPLAATQEKPARQAPAPRFAPLSEQQAVSRLSSAIEQDGVYAPMALACMSFVVEERTPESFGIAVREKHGGRCGGDPKTAPVLDRMKVDRTSGAISVYDLLEDEYYSWAEFRKHRSGQGQ